MNPLAVIVLVVNDPTHTRNTVVVAERLSLTVGVICV